MARGVPGFVRIGAALAGCALVAACTPEAGPTQTPTPSLEPPSSTSAPSASVSPAPSAPPTETEIERRQRLDWEAAERAYRTATAESDRLAVQGGVREPTKKLRRVATGEFLDLTMQNLRLLQSRNWRFKGGVTVLAVRREGGWSAGVLSLVACEDNSSWEVIDTNGRVVTPEGRSDYIQTLIVKKAGRLWKVTDLTTQKVSNVSEGNCQ